MTFLAVSDGAGSRKFSRIGARVSCRAAVSWLTQAVAQLAGDQPDLLAHLALPLADPAGLAACQAMADAVQQAVDAGRRAVEAAFAARAQDPVYAAVLGRDLTLGDFSATLLLAAAIPVGKTPGDPTAGDLLVITCQIGDGAVALLDTKAPLSGAVKPMGEPDSGDFSGETEFLTSPRMGEQQILQSRTKISRSHADKLLVMTDGVADDYFPCQTQLVRLYFDLVLHGVLEPTCHRRPQTPLTREEMGLIRRIPDPATVPWINDPRVSVSLQSAKRLCETGDFTLAELWKDPRVLALARLELPGLLDRVSDPSQRLKIWLDNYVERGSFDDRTLVIAEF
jgi:hypothetical protein